MNKLPSLYTSLNNDNDIAEWVKLIKDNPTEAISTYYKAFCEENSNGYCDLFKLFQLLGILEERKAKGESIVATGSTSDTADQQTLKPIYDALSDLDKKIDSKPKQPAQQSSDTSNQEKLAELQQQIEVLNKKKKRTSND